MNILDTMRGLVRRWYIAVPGVVLAIVAAIMTWNVVQPDYQRTATQILLPGTGTLPENSSNPYLYLGGLTVVADVVVRAVGSDEALRDLSKSYPSAQIEISRDGTTAGPVILISVTAASDAEAAAVVDSLVSRTSTTLDSLQTAENIAPADRVTVTPLAIDEVGTAEPKTRILLTVGVGGGIALLALVAASLVDGLSKKPRRRFEGDPEPLDPDAVSSDAPEEVSRSTVTSQADEPDEFSVAADGDLDEADRKRRTRFVSQRGS